MNNYFDGVKSIEEGKSLYRRLAMKLHPDHGGNEEEFKILQNDYERFLNAFMAGAFSMYEQSTGKEAHGNINTFSDILNKIIHWNINIEVIGYWIYCFNSIEYREQLKELGFWFSGKHKAWVYSGSGKKSIKSRYTTDDVRSMHGSTAVRNKDDNQQKIA